MEAAGFGRGRQAVLLIFDITWVVRQRQLTTKSSMLLSPATRSQRFNIRILAHGRIQHVRPQVPSRLLFSWFRKSKPTTQPKEQAPVLTQDNLFHPFSKSPFPAIRARGDAIQLLAPCPVCASSHTSTHAHAQAQPRAVKFECPDCGWPSHCSHEHWAEDTEHKKYCSRLREVNEDEHDLRSGRRMREFELPGESTDECNLTS